MIFSLFICLFVNFFSSFWCKISFNIILFIQIKIKLSSKFVVGYFFFLHFVIALRSQVFVCFALLHIRSWSESGGVLVFFAVAHLVIWLCLLPSSQRTKRCSLTATAVPLKINSNRRQRTNEQTSKMNFQISLSRADEMSLIYTMPFFK